MQKIILDTIKSFRKEFNVVRYEQDGLQHEGFMYGHNPTSKDLENFLEQALTKSFEAGQKSREKEIVESYNEWYQQNCKKNNVVRKTPYTIFHKIIKSLSLTKESK